jgi:hypothetical protein
VFDATEILQDEGDGNTGYGVSSLGDTKLNRFLAKNEHVHKNFYTF